ERSRLEGLKRGPVAGIEQNDRERDRADGIGRFVAGKIDSETIHSRDQPDYQEEKQQGSAEAEGKQAGECGEQDERSQNQCDEIKCVQPSASNLSLRADPKNFNAYSAKHL